MSDEISDEHKGMIEAVRVLADAPLNTTARLVKLVRDCMFAAIVVIALWLGYIGATNSEETAKATQERLVCSGRFQDRVDAEGLSLAIAQGELIVVISTVAPGPDRTVAVGNKVAELDAATLRAKGAVDAKAEYNNSGRPLPCPID
jgi:hypothetical protein